MGKLIIFCSALAMLAGCHSRLDTSSSVFLQRAKNKRSLLEMGFTHPVVKPIDGGGIAFPASFLKEINERRKKRSDNTLNKKIGDTTLSYFFREDELEEIDIVISHPDTAKLYKLLDSLGFEQRSPDGVKRIFVNVKADIRYVMHLARRQVVFADDIYWKERANKPQAPTPPLDSVSVLSGSKLDSFQRQK